MSLLAIAVLGLYFLTLLILAAYGLHRYQMVFLYFQHRHARAGPAPPLTRRPFVTVQLPVYNEMYVVERLLASVAAIRHPPELLEIQVLDDSTDETARLVEAAVERYRARGLDIHHLRRPHRHGFKAGALAAGLNAARGEFVLIFDADFVAPPEILEATLGHFADPRVGMVQVRWGHVNRECSLLTQVQAILLDGHFILEHGGRHRSGRFFNFNGTAGVWRRRAIDDAGGWQHDTLTEDLDLSYRAQLRGWRFVFLPDVVSRAEVPVEMDAFRSQQHRWAKGAIQTCRKLLPAILASGLPRRIKTEATIHLTANFAYPLMVLLSLLMFPALVIRSELGLDALIMLDLPLFAAATLSICSFYLVSQREVAVHRPWQRLCYLPAVLSMGIGLSLNNAGAVLEALAGRRSEFARTPKLGIETAGEEWRPRRYRSQPSRLPILELLFGVYFSVMAGYAVGHHLFSSLPLIVLFQTGFLYAAGTSLLQGFVQPPITASFPASRSIPVRSGHTPFR